MSSKKTPKGRTTLKALEDIPTSVRKKGAPVSFVFADEDESASVSSSDEETSLRNTKGKTQLVKKTTGKGRSKDEKENVEEQLDLLSLLKQGKKDNGLTVANKWLPRADSEPGVCEMLVLLLTMGGGSAESSQIPEFRKSASSTLSAACDDCVFEGTAPILAKSPEAKRLVKALTTFFYEIGRSRNRDACISAFECCQAASKVAAKTVRQVGTVSAMYLGLGLLDRVAQLHKELERATGLFITEANECETKIKNPRTKQTVHEAATEFIAALEAVPKFVCRKPPANEAEISADNTADEVIEEVQRTMDAWRALGKDGSLSDKARQTANECLKIAKELRMNERRALEGRDSVFHEVTKARFRDVDPQVRKTTAELLGEWSAVCPDAMSVSHRSKYLGWLLYDKDSEVRLGALEGLSRLAEAESPNKEEIVQRLLVFTNRFANRIRGMFNDPDPQVTAGAIRLCRVLYKGNLLSRENDGELFDDAEDLIFYAPERNDCELAANEMSPWEDVRREAAHLAETLDPRLVVSDQSGDAEEKEDDDEKMEEEEEESDEEEDQGAKSTKRSRKAKPVKKQTKKRQPIKAKTENANEVRLRAFIDLVLRRLGPNSTPYAHLETEFAFSAFYPSTEVENEDSAQKKSPHFLADLDTMCSMMMDDTLSAKDERIPRVLATILLCAVRKSRSNTASGETIQPAPVKSRAVRGKRAKAVGSGDAEDSLARKLPDLLVRFRPDPFTLERLVQIVPLVPSFTSQIDKLLRELAAIATEKTLEELLEATCLALSALCEDNRAESSQAKQTLETIAAISSKAFAQVVSESDVDDENSIQDSTAWLARCAALACGTTLGSAAVGGDEALHSFFLSRVVRSRASSGMLSNWLVFAIKLGLGCAAWHVFACEEPSVSSEILARAKRDRNLLAEAFRKSFDLLLESPQEDGQQKSGLALKFLTLFHDTRSLFWPGNPLLGWTPSADLTDKADAVFMELVIPFIENEPAAIRVAYEKVLVPMARTALYACPREDAKSAAFVLRFVRVGANTGGTKNEEDAEEEQMSASLLRRCALRLNTEMRKTDVDRWLQAHLETLNLDSSHSEALSKTLGPSSDKIAQAIGSAVSGMVCRAIRLAKQQQSESLLNAVAPYLVFCKQGSRARERIVSVWEQLSPDMRADNEKFGSTFEAKLFRTTKRGRNSLEGIQGDGDNDMNVEEESPKDTGKPKSEKKMRSSLGAGKKREPKNADNEEFDEDSSPVRKVARPLDFKASSTAKKSYSSKKKALSEHDKEISRLERSVFEQNSDEDDEEEKEPERKVAGKGRRGRGAAASEVNEFEDEEAHTVASSKGQRGKASQTKKSVSSSTSKSTSSSRKRKATESQTDSSDQEEKEESDNQQVSSEGDDDDDDDNDIGFRPRATTTRRAKAKA